MTEILAPDIYRAHWSYTAVVAQSGAFWEVYKHAPHDDELFLRINVIQFLILLVSNFFQFTKETWIQMKIRFKSDSKPKVT
jgi:hypothetical protein